MAGFVKFQAGAWRKVIGYTLIESALVLAVIGVMIGSGTASYRIWKKNAATATTANNLGVVMDAVAEFLVKNGRYPCTAPPDAARTSTAYGKEDCGVAGSVIRGAVPFRTLNLPETLSEDGYHNRLHYVVTKVLTSASTYASTSGAIFVGDKNGTSVTSPPGKVHFLAFSSGEDQAGAYNHEGRQTFPCAATGIDKLNCDSLTDNVYSTTQMAPVAGAGHFDDTVRIASSAKEPLWMATATGGTDIRDTGLADTMGIGVMPTDSTVKLEVAGNMRAAGSVRATNICKGDGTNCFGAELIAEPGLGHPSMNCPRIDPVTSALLDPATHIYVEKIANGRVYCTSSVPFTCPSGALRTIDTVTGLPVCGDPLVWSPPVFVYPPVVPGVCGIANGVNYSSPPPAPSLCSVGNVAGFSGTGPWTWSCLGSGGGLPASCSTAAAVIVAAVNGACGSTVTASTLTSASAGLCSTGTVGSFSGTGPWNWNCNGSGAGSTSQSCSATVIPLGTVCGPQGTAFHQQTYANGQVMQEHIITLTSAATTFNLTGNTAVCAPMPINAHPFRYEIFVNTGPQLSDPAGASLFALNPASYTYPTNPYCPAPNWSVNEASFPALLGPGSYRIRQTALNTTPCSDLTNCGGLLTVQVCQEAGPGPGRFNGVCGSAFAAYTATAPTTGLCTQGTASPVVAVGSPVQLWRWTCQGVGPGTSTADCSAPPPPTAILTDGACGAANGVPAAALTATSPGLCSAGTVAGFAGTGGWTWNCNGTGGSTVNSPCAAPLSTLPEDGVCGTVDGTAVSSLTAASPNLCGAGVVASFGLITGGWNWNCNGINGSSVGDVCSASTAILPVDGVCGTAHGAATASLTSSSPNLCAAGTVGSFGGTWNWTCNGVGGSLVNAPCSAPPLSVVGDLYVLNYNVSNISLIDTSANAVVATIPRSFGVGTIAFSPVTNRIYAVVPGIPSSFLEVYDAATYGLLTTFSIPMMFPGEILLNPATNRAYIQGAMGTMVMDINTGAVLATLPTGPVGGLNLDAAANRLYVGDTVGQKVDTFDTLSNTIIGTNTLPVGTILADAAVDSAANRLYVSSQVPQYVYVIDIASNTLIASIPVPLPRGIVVNPTTNRAYVVSAGDNVFVLDTVTNTIVATIPLPAGSNGGGIKLNPATNRVYTTNTLNNSVSVINTITNTVVTTIAVGANPTTLTSSW